MATPPKPADYCTSTSRCTRTTPKHGCCWPPSPRRTPASNTLAKPSPSSLITRSSAKPYSGHNGELTPKRSASNFPPSPTLSLPLREAALIQTNPPLMRPRPNPPRLNSNPNRLPRHASECANHNLQLATCNPPLITRNLRPVAPRSGHLSREAVICHL